jgi:hypothetical protein
MIILSCILALAAMTKLVCGFLIGYYPPLFWLFLVEGAASLVCVLGAIACLVITIALARKGRTSVWFHIVVKMYGLGDFGGFTIVPDGRVSHGLRIADGLYWSDSSGFW